MSKKRRLWGKKIIDFLFIFIIINSFANTPYWSGLTYWKANAQTNSCPIHTIGLSRHTFTEENRGEVKELQRILSKIPNIGWKSSYHISGTFGRGTEALVRRFQKAYNLNSTGVLDQPTINKLCQIWAYQNNISQLGSSSGRTQGTSSTIQSTTPSTISPLESNYLPPELSGGGSSGTTGRMKTCTYNTWSRDPHYCGDKPYCCVPYTTYVSSDRPCPGDMCESDDDYTGQYLSDPNFWEKRDEGIYKECKPKKCTAEGCVPTFVGYVDVSKGEQCPPDQCSTTKECNLLYKKCVYNTCITVIPTQGIAECRTVTKYIPKDQHCPGDMCTDPGGGHGQRECSDYYFYNSQGDRECIVNKCVDSGTVYAKCIPEKVRVPAGTKVCPANECDNSGDCGNPLYKKCTYKECIQGKCQQITISVPAIQDCPKDACPNGDKDCENISSGKTKVCRYNECRYTINSAACIQKTVQVSEDVDCAELYPDECRPTVDDPSGGCERQKNPPCDLYQCVSGKCLWSHYEICPFSSVPHPECRLGHDEDCGGGKHYSCYANNHTCYYDPAGGYTSKEECQEHCGTPDPNAPQPKWGWSCNPATGKCEFVAAGNYPDTDMGKRQCANSCEKKEETNTKTCTWTTCDKSSIPPKCREYVNNSWPEDKPCPQDDGCIPGESCVPPGDELIDCNIFVCDNGTCHRKIIQDVPKSVGCPDSHPDCWTVGVKCDENNNPNKCGCQGNVAVCTPEGNGVSCASPADCPPCGGGGGECEGNQPKINKTGYKCVNGECKSFTKLVCPEDQLMSLADCEAICGLFEQKCECDTSTGTCIQNDFGSMTCAQCAQVCEKSPEPTKHYYCNSNTGECIEDPNGGFTSKQSCESVCHAATTLKCVNGKCTTVPGNNPPQCTTDSDCSTSSGCTSNSDCGPCEICDFITHQCKPVSCPSGYVCDNHHGCKPESSSTTSTTSSVRFKCFNGQCEATTGSGYSSYEECMQHCSTTTTTTVTSTTTTTVNPCAGAECGICAGVDYGSCPAGQKCVAYKCVDVCAGYECGTRDGVNCGTCPSGYTCQNHHCVEENVCECTYCYNGYCITDRHHSCPCPPSTCTTNEDCREGSFLPPLDILSLSVDEVLNELRAFIFGLQNK